MYHLKKIVTHDELITLPKCMYSLKNVYTFENQGELTDETHKININICNQVNKLLKKPNKEMADLEERQDLLLKKLDILYDRIKSISSLVPKSVNSSLVSNNLFKSVDAPEEIVLMLHYNNLPWFLFKLIKDNEPVNDIQWHIHSSVPNENVPKLISFSKKLVGYNKISKKNNLRLIFKGASADPELKLSSLGTPIVGYVNILRYLAFVFPNTISYDFEDHNIDNLLDVCHLLEKASDKEKENLIKKLFSQYNDWIYSKKFTIVDLAAYNVFKNSQNCMKYAPKEWFNKCEKLCS